MNSQPLLDMFRAWVSPPQQRCPTCSDISVIPTGYRVCEPCLDEIPWIERVVCRICGRADDCPDCRRRLERGRPAAFVAHRSAVRYDANMKAWLARYKYRGDETLEPVLSWMLIAAYERLQLDIGAVGMRHPFDAITYVPLGRKRMEERGFNQSARLAASLAKQTGIPLIPLLHRHVESDRQSKKDRQRRIREIRGAFLPSQRHARHLAQAMQSHQHDRAIRLLLIDDVYTTGSTLDECSRTIRSILPCRICAITWARA